MIEEDGDEAPTCGSEGHGCESHPDTPIEQCDCEDVDEEFGYEGGPEQAARLEDVAGNWERLSEMITAVQSQVEGLRSRLSDDEWSAVSRTYFDGNLQGFEEELTEVAVSAREVGDWLNGVGEHLREYDRQVQEQRNALIRLGVEMAASMVIGLMVPVVGKLLMAWRAKRIRDVVITIKELGTGLHTTIRVSTQGAAAVVRIKQTTRAQRFIFAWASGVGTEALKHTGSRMFSERTANPFDVWDGEDALTVIVSGGVSGRLRSLRQARSASRPSYLRQAGWGAFDNVAEGVVTTTLVDRLMGRGVAETWETIQDEALRNAISGLGSGALGEFTDRLFAPEVTALGLETPPPPDGYTATDSGLYVPEHLNSDGPASDLTLIDPVPGYTQRDSGIWVPDSDFAPPNQLILPDTPAAHGAASIEDLWIPESAHSSADLSSTANSTAPAFEFPSTSSGNGASANGLSRVAGEPQFALPGASA